jgi:hypothetical protein
MIDGAFYGGRYRFESPMRMLWKTGDFIAMIHSIWLIRIEISTVSSSWSPHILVASWIIIDVINTKKERVWSFEWKL